MPRHPPVLLITLLFLVCKALGVSPFDEWSWIAASSPAWISLSLGAVHFALSLTKRQLETLGRIVRLALLYAGSLTRSE